MQLNNIVTLTSLALLSSVEAYNAYSYDAAAVAPGVVVGNNGKDMSLARSIKRFKNNNEWPVKGPLNTILGFNKARGLLDGITAAQVLVFSRANSYLFKKLSKKQLVDIAAYFDATAAINDAAGSPLPEQVNAAIALIMENADPKNWPDNLSPGLIDGFVHIPATVSQLRKMNPTLVKNRPVEIMKLLASDATRFPVLANKSILTQLLKSPDACKELNPEAFKFIARDSAASKCITSDVFIRLDQIHGDAGSAKLTRFLPDSVFEKLEQHLHTDFSTYCTPDQAAKWQIKSIKVQPCLAQIGFMNRRQAAALPVKVYLKLFEDARTDPTAAGLLKYWGFWKHLPTKALKEAVEEIDVSTIIPAEAFKQMTTEQRQLLLDAGDKDNQTDCGKLPLTILKGKKKRLVGLKGSKKCFHALETRADEGKWIFRALLLDMFDGKLGGKVTAKAVADFEVKLRREKKTNADGKSVSRPDLELKGLLAMEALQNKEKGPEFVKSFFHHKDKDVVEAACKAISSSELRKTKWLQTMMTKACVKHIDFSLDDAKRMHPNIWANMNKEQVKKLGDRSDLKELEGPFMEGLAANKYFAAMTCKKRTKENKDGDDVDRKPLLALVKPSERAKYFGSKYVSVLPDDAECIATLAAHVASLADDALASVNAGWVSKHKAVLDNLRPEQHGRISDNLEADSYPAALTAAQVQSMSDERVAHLTAKFLNHMTSTNLSYFSADQVKRLSPDSLVLLCGDKAKAIKHELSEAQKAALGKDCPAQEGSMAPTNAHIGAFTAAAALAAGSLALLF